MAYKLKDKNREESENMIEFFHIVHKALRKFGITKLVDAVRQLEVEDVNFNYVHIKNFIFQTVCEEFDIPIQDLKSKKRGKVTIARKIIIIMLKKYLQLKDVDLSRYFGRCRQVFYNLMKEYRKLDRKDKMDNKIFFEKYDIINLKIENFIKTLNTK